MAMKRTPNTSTQYKNVQAAAPTQPWTRHLSIVRKGRDRWNGQPPQLGPAREGRATSNKATPVRAVRNKLGRTLARPRRHIPNTDHHPPP
eukprot:gene28320-31434_t